MFFLSNKKREAVLFAFVSWRKVKMVLTRRQKKETLHFIKVGGKITDSELYSEVQQSGFLNASSL